MLNYNLLEILPVMLTVGWLAYGMIFYWNKYKKAQSEFGNNVIFFEL